MSLKRKYSDSGVNGAVSEPSQALLGECVTRSLKKLKRESKDSSLSSTSNPKIFSTKSESENTAWSSKSTSTAEPGSTDIELESDLDSDSESSFDTSTSSSDEESDDPDGASSEESSKDLGSSREEDATGDENTDQSDTSSDLSINTDDDPEKVVTLRPGKKPKMRSPSTKKSNFLLKRLQAFLPELQNANQVLERDRMEGRLEQRMIENVEEGEERVIEMDLGLGVLEERNSGDRGDTSAHEDAGAEAEIDVLGRLMGHEPKVFSIDEME